jgi:ABC-type transporter Mla subunit MlaD
MSQTSSQFKIGLFVLTGLAIVLAGLVAFGVRRKLERKTEFETYVLGSVDGLSVGAAVKLRGVNVGEVTRLSFSWIEYPGGQPWCVVVHFDVKTSVLPGAPAAANVGEGVQRGLRAIVESQGITGAAILSLVDVDPAKNPPLEFTWKPHRGVIPSAPSQFSQILASVQGTFATLQKLDVERLVASLDLTLRSADKALQKLDQFDAKRLSDSLNEAALSIAGALQETQALAKDARGTLQGMGLEAVGRDADRLVVGLQESNARLQQLLDRFSSVDIRDLNETLAGTRQAARHLNDAIEELKKYPSGFFFGQEPPPARGVEKE